MTGEVQQIQDDGQSWEICSAREVSGDRVGRFCLYETQNMWTFIMLDTYTGKNWQVQFSVKGEDYMFAAPINMFSLAYPETTSNWTNRFQMFSTLNPQLHSRSATYIKRNGLLIRKITIKSSRPFQCAYHPLPISDLSIRNQWPQVM